MHGLTPRLIRSGAQSALSNVVGDSSPRPTYSLVDLGEGTPYAVASDGTVVLDRPGETNSLSRTKGGTDDPLGENFYFSSMNDGGDIVGQDSVGGGSTGYAILATDAAGVRRRWSAEGYSTLTGAGASYLGTWLSQINEKRVIAGAEYRSEKVRNIESIHVREFVSSAPFNFTTIASSSSQYDWWQERRFGEQGTFYEIRDLDNHGGAVGLQRSAPAYENTPLYFGSAPRPSGDSAFNPFALNDEGLVLGRSEGVIKFWEPSLGAFITLEVPNPVGDYDRLRVTDPPSDPDAPTFILAGNNLIIRTWKDAEGQPSDFPIYITLAAAELLPAGSPYTNLRLQNIANNGVLVATADKQGDPFSHALMLVQVELMVDANRDGKMSFTDAAIHDKDGTTAEKPYRFWLNDDQDNVLTPDSATGSIRISEGETSPVLVADNTQSKIQTKRNLEDFSRLWIDLASLRYEVLGGLIQVGLKWKTVESGQPAINIYPSEDGKGSTAYLTNDAAAARQSSGIFNNAVTDKNNKQTVDGNGTFIFRADYWNSITTENSKKCFLFEGKKEGKGELVVVFLDRNGNELSTGGSVWIELKEVRKLYERGKITLDAPEIPDPFDNDLPAALQWTWDPWNWQPEIDPSAEDKTIIYVHGWRMTYNEYLSWADTSFKRLYQLGFKGRFYAFHWPTFNGDNNGLSLLDLYKPGGTSYNPSEYRAWLSGPALADFVNQLPNPGARYLLAHSMGNVTAGSALRNGMQLTRYAMCNSAMAAMAYDATIVDDNYETPDTDLDLQTRQSFGLANRLNPIATEIVNFTLPADYALGQWSANNEFFKPQPFLAHNYYYHPHHAPGRKLTYEGILSVRLITSVPEAMGYVTQSRSRAAGAKQSIAGSVKSFVNMGPGGYNFGVEHSAEWVYSVQRTSGFWKEILTKFDVDVNER